MTKSAFFYVQPTLLDRELHRNLKVQPLNDVRFAAESTAVPILSVEWAESCLEFPIVFSKGKDEQWMALAVTGLRDGQNLFVDTDGRWTGRYVPACLRRYPFVLVQDGASAEKLGVAIDLGSAAVGEDVEGGVPLFEASGEPAPALQSVLQLLGEFQTQAGATHQFIQRLMDAGLLVEANMEVKGRHGQVANLVGSWVVNEAKLRELGEAQVFALFQSGELALVYAHLLSLRNLIGMVERQAKLAAH